MKEILHETDKVCYYSFLMSLAKHEAINQTIGRFKFLQLLLILLLQFLLLLCYQPVHIVLVCTCDLKDQITFYEQFLQKTKLLQVVHIFFHATK